MPEKISNEANNFPLKVLDEVNFWHRLLGQASNDCTFYFTIIPFYVWNYEKPITSEGSWNCLRRRKVTNITSSVFSYPLKWAVLIKSFSSETTFTLISVHKRSHYPLLVPVLSCFLERRMLISRVVMRYLRQARPKIEVGVSMIRVVSYGLIKMFHGFL